MKYTLEIEESLFAELIDLSKQLGIDTNKLIIACIKEHIISSDVFNGLITKKTN